MKIRKIGKEDIEIVTRIHLAAFPGFFLSELGYAFLKVFYQYVVEEKSGIALIIVDDDNGIVGSVVGSVEPSGFYSKAIKKKLIKFAISAIPAAVKKPSIIPRLLRALSKPGETKKLPGDCELMSICILPEYSGKGLGKILEKAFCREAKKRDAKIVELTTDRNENEKTNGFYKSAGYVLNDVFVTREGRCMNRYVKFLDQYRIK